jgi:phosphoribosylaminoimidazole (AIR) synthetase
MVVIVARENVQQALLLLNAAGEKAVEIGRIESRSDGEAQTIVV